jgi:hypothetical protein
MIASAQPTIEIPMSTRPSLLFRCAGALAAIFVITVFVMIAALFSDQKLPINLWLNEYGLWLLAGEVGLLLVVSFLAMMTDTPQSEKGTDMKDEVG